MKNPLSSQIAELQSLRGVPVIVYSASINDESVDVLYECLRKLGQQEQLNFVLLTSGGEVTTTHQLALLLHEYTHHLTILVPHTARSAGTLLCLCANELVLGPMAKLGPIDPHVGAVSPSAHDTPSMISATDIYTFRKMAEDWFGVTRKKDRLQVLALLAQRIFPATLSSFYRFDQQIRHIAHELLVYQMPNAEIETRKRIIDQLAGGQYGHDYIISRGEIRNLGLNVRFASSKEEQLLWELLLACRGQIPSYLGLVEKEETIGLIASEGFFARQIQDWIDLPIRKRADSETESLTQSGRINDVHWEINS